MSKLKCELSKCGSDAELDFSSVTDYGNRPHQSGDVTCKDRGCDAEIGLYDFNPDDKSINPTEILTRKWNTRAPQNEWISVDDLVLLKNDDDYIVVCDVDYKAETFGVDAGNKYEYSYNFDDVEKVFRSVPPPPKAD